MLRLLTKRAKTVAGHMRTTNNYSVQKYFKNNVQNCKIQPPTSVRVLSKATNGRPINSFNRDEEKNLPLTLMFHDIKTSQDVLLRQLSNVVTAVSTIQEKIDTYQKQMEVIETRVSINEDRQFKMANDLLLIKEDVTVLKKIATDLKAQSTCSPLHCAEISDGEENREIVELIHNVMGPTIQQNSAVATAELEKVHGTSGSRLHQDEKAGSQLIKTLKENSQENSVRSLKKENSNIYVYPDFSTWIKLTFVHGGKWRFFLSATKLEEFVQWVLTRPAVFPGKPQLIAQRHYPFAGLFTCLTTLCLSAFNYLYCFFHSTKEQVTRM
ncbi:coiled-coil domain-containing protein 54 [Trichosurus vulpecula]|uniref:coiled-coil domain-containing protein 54 n=1 Tax=Trichosurus vulpecula TaxID=9337 RepID=UPI00186B2925|nr:coiled-coil domain-containing protein 54 [Trichosurus vulpecula]